MPRGRSQLVESFVSLVPINRLTALSFDSMDHGAWPLFVDGVTCLVNSVSVCPSLAHPPPLPVDGWLFVVMAMRSRSTAAQGGRSVRATQLAPQTFENCAVFVLGEVTAPQCFFCRTKVFHELSASCIDLFVSGFVQSLHPHSCRPHSSRTLGWCLFAASAHLIRRPTTVILSPFCSKVGTGFHLQTVQYSGGKSLGALAKRPCRRSSTLVQHCLNELLPHHRRPHGVTSGVTQSVAQARGATLNGLPKPVLKSDPEVVASEEFRPDGGHGTRRVWNEILPAIVSQPCGWITCCQQWRFLGVASPWRLPPGHRFLYPGRRICDEVAHCPSNPQSCRALRLWYGCIDFVESGSNNLPIIFDAHCWSTASATNAAKQSMNMDLNNSPGTATSACQPRQALTGRAARPNHKMDASHSDGVHHRLVMRNGQSYDTTSSFFKHPGE